MNLSSLPCRNGSGQRGVRLALARGGSSAAMAGADVGRPQRSTAAQAWQPVGTPKPHPAGLGASTMTPPSVITPPLNARSKTKLADWGSNGHHQLGTICSAQRPSRSAGRARGEAYSGLGGNRLARRLANHLPQLPKHSPHMRGTTQRSSLQQQIVTPTMMPTTVPNTIVTDQCRALVAPVD